MPRLEDLLSATNHCTAQQLLGALIEDHFPGKTVVTATLRTSSIVVLKMVSDIDRHTPVVFCRRGSLFEESRRYREAIIELLGLTNVSVTEGREQEVDARAGDYDHYERMLVEFEHGPGRSREIVHLNDTLAPFECWIAAVYHVRAPLDARRRIDAEGRLIRVDPLADWTREQVRQFMAEHNLPHHPRTYRNALKMPPREDNSPVETFNV